MLITFLILFVGGDSLAIRSAVRSPAINLIKDLDVASDEIFVRRSATSMLSGKKPVAAAVSFTCLLFRQMYFIFAIKFKHLQVELKVPSSTVQFKEPHF
ncbi:hypothetical protein L1887_11549 [Cichorium endivia]|nr:hypothetical protein L1887_11549 [Cichorium endivia]